MPSADTAGRRWALLSITGDGMQNDGNRLVELSLLDLARPPLASFSVFRPPRPEWLAQLAQAECDLLVCSGTTLLVTDRNPFWEWSAAAERSGMTCAMVAGCFWNLSSGEDDRLPDTRAIFSVRDPYSQRVCVRLGLDVPLVACPSLVWNERPPREGSRSGVVIGLHRKVKEYEACWFTSLARQLDSPVTVLVQEPEELSLAKQIAADTAGRIVIVGLLATRCEWRAIFEDARLCITGRLHQALPAAALNVPSVIVVPNDKARADSRYTLAEHIGIPVMTTSSPIREVMERASVGDHSRIQMLVAGLLRFLDGLDVLKRGATPSMPLDAVAQLGQAQIAILNSRLRELQYQTTGRTAS
jgi:hypothetical protein